MVVTELFFYELMVKYLTQVFNRKIMTNQGKYYPFHGRFVGKLGKTQGKKTGFLVATVKICYTYRTVINTFNTLPKEDSKNI